MKRLLFLCYALGLLLLTSCGKDDTKLEQDLHLRHKGADMPIWVRGNLASRKIVLFLHGGPGDCAMCYRYYLKDLEDHVAVAYWDQRVAGSSSGKVDPATLTYEQFGEDAYYVVKLLRQKYPQAEVYLLAHSYGVELAWEFLTHKPEHQQLVKGLMAVNGVYSNYRWLVQMREWVLREARQQGNTAAESFALANPVTPQTLMTLDWQQYYRYMLDLDGNPVSLYDNKKFLLQYLFASPNTALGQFSHGNAYSGFDKTQLLQYDRSAQLPTVRIPVALFWGRKDGVVPIEIAHETQALLTNAPSKDLVTFDNSWHEPFVAEQAKFVREVLRFVQ
ncbi:alpha/beta fold hydrolase [Hymenobacter sp. B81]|uniref:alpha/beta fold hydrolase n=1 Tax=Hymenobacter sp. B81 TaxID=3344878 RepID=UPI0037DD7906